MSSEKKAEVVSNLGGAKQFTVNKDGAVNSSHTKFLQNNGGCVGKDVPVKTPMTCKNNVCTLKK